MTGWAALGVGVLALALAVALLRQRQRSRTLEQALDRTSGDLEHLERAFARFAPQDVVERLSGGASDIPPSHREVTVMFADIVGFTRLSEELEPAVMVPVLNDYFELMSRVIREHHGHVSRIMGDGLMALFGALQPNTWQSADAVKAALAMREALTEYNVGLVDKGLPPLRFGIGIHRGEVVAAVVGSDDLMEFTVLGDPVNVAARVETLTRIHGVDVLITTEVRERLDERFEVREQPPVAVKGKSLPMVTWAVDGFRDPAGSAG
jgi:adenylate cyclase